jgi:hypothetical protein
VLILKEKRNKLAARAWKGVFVGYVEELEKLYLVWHLEEKKVFHVWFIWFDEAYSGLPNEDLRTLGDDHRDMPREEGTASRQVDRTAEDETDDKDDDVDSPNNLEEPGGDDSSEGAGEGVEEDGGHHGQSSGTLAAGEDLDEEGANRHGRGSSYDSDISDVIVVDLDNDTALQPTSETKVQEHKERAIEKRAKEDA